MKFKKFVYYLMMILFSLAIVELCSFIYTTSELGSKTFRGNLPAYSKKDFTKTFWADINPHFGVWHHSNSNVKHTMSCFEVEYSANSHGARDKKRTLGSTKNRTIFLGDSFVEGYGVSSDKRFTDLLENETKIEHLNFGTAGNFGTIQSFLLYKHLASKFEHSKVIIGILPGNDFFENDLESGKIFFENRYRPYLEGQYPHYKLIYFNDNLEQVKKRSKSPLIHLRKRLFEFSHTAAVVKQLINTYKMKTTNFSNPNNPYSLVFLSQTDTFSGYYHFSKKPFLLMRYTLEKIIEEAGGRDVNVLLIPHLIDLQYYEKEGEAPLSREFRKLGEELGVKVFDLLPYMHGREKNWDRYFYSCDSHWNEFGHQVAFEYLKDRLYSANELSGQK